MISVKSQRNPEELINPFGGKGKLTLDYLLDSTCCPESVNMHAIATLEPGSVIGNHTHTGESECYYIISGKAEYNDDGYFRQLSAGDVTFTADGHSHSIKNIGSDNLVFVALIIKS